MSIHLEDQRGRKPSRSIEAMQPGESVSSTWQGVTYMSRMDQFTRELGRAWFGDHSISADVAPGRERRQVPGTEHLRHGPIVVVLASTTRRPS